MSLSVQIDPKEIEQYVADAVLKSAIGPLVEKVINDALKSLDSGYHNPLERAIANYVQKIVLDVVTEEYGDKIRAAVREYVTDAAVDELVNKGWKAWWDKVIQ